MIRSVSESDLASSVSEFAIEHLIVSATFEPRAFTLWNQISDRIPGRKIVCYNANHRSYIQKSLQEFSERAEPDAVPLNSDDPRITFDALKEAIEGLPRGRVAIDITGFTKESLAMLLYIARYRLADPSKLCVYYHRAAAYGASPSKGWLSRGIKDVRSIVGFGGHVRVSGDTHLFILPGFETDRARNIIDAVEPDMISIGVPLVSSGRDHDAGGFSNPHEEPLLEFVREIQNVYANIGLSQFDFSALDPIRTRDSIMAAVAGEENNVVVACLNSKVSTVGACLAAICNPMIQMLYAQPISYNIECYSEPSGEFLFFNIEYD